MPNVSNMFHILCRTTSENCNKISGGSASGFRVLNTDPDPRPEFLRVKKYLKNFMHFFSSIFTYMKKIEKVFRKLVSSL